MHPAEPILLPATATVRDALVTIDRGGLGVCALVDPAGRPLALLSDADLRRGLIAGCALADPARPLAAGPPVVRPLNDPRDRIDHAARTAGAPFVAVVDPDGRLVGIEAVDLAAPRPALPNRVVVMAGGVGRRLRPHTLNTPKPMLKVGPKPILETIVEGFVKYGFTRFAFCVNYRADLIVDHFGDGRRHGVEIAYVQEEAPLGTAGALALLPARPAEPFFVVNGDVLTSVNFAHLLARHADSGARATMCVREYEHEIPFGVVAVDGDRLAAIAEKPLSRHLVNAGIYVLDPSMLALLERGERIDMPALFARALAAGAPVHAYPITEYWIDIGQRDDFARANFEYADRGTGDAAPV